MGPAPTGQCLMPARLPFMHQGASWIFGMDAGAVTVRWQGGYGIVARVDFRRGYNILPGQSLFVGPTGRSILDLGRVQGLDPSYYRVFQSNEVSICR